MSKVLDSWFLAEADVPSHAASVATQVMVESKLLPPTGWRTKENDLLKNMAYCQEVTEDDASSFSSLSVKHLLMTGGFVQRKQIHRHLPTCHKGFNGQTGCRLCRPYALVWATHPVLLSPKGKRGSEVFEYVASELKYLSMAAVQSRLSYSKQQDPLLKTSKDLIVWELRRPEINVDLYLPVYLGAQRLTEIDVKKMEIGALGSLVAMHSEELRDLLVGILKEKGATEVHRVYEKVRGMLRSRNGDVVECNPHLSLCTGSHNNCSLLGSSEQGKAAIFYISSYISKNKVQFEHSRCPGPSIFCSYRKPGQMSTTTPAPQRTAVRLGEQHGTFCSERSIRCRFRWS